jgi:hypothetical protein
MDTLLENVETNKAKFIRLPSILANSVVLLDKSVPIEEDKRNRRKRCVLSTKLASTTFENNAGEQLHHEGIIESSRW